VTASLTMGLTDVLRTRADGTAETTGSEELRRLREQVAKLISEQKRMNTTMQSMREEMAKANEPTETARLKVRTARQELQDAIRRNDELRQKLREEKERAESLRKEMATKQRKREVEPMEVEIVPSPHEGRTNPPTPPVTTRPTERELRDFPALRPAIQGRVSVIPGRPLPPPEAIVDGEVIPEGLLQKEKGDKGPEMGWHGTIFLGSRDPTGTW